MAESIVEITDDSEKNFILAKLVSLYGDTVDFDVISLVAQEKEWNEEKCIACLKVLGDYKDTDTGFKCFNDNQRTPPNDLSNVSSAASNNQLGPPGRTEGDEVVQLRARSYTRVAGVAATKTVKPKMAGNIGNAQGRMPPIRQSSPSNTGMQKSVESQEHHDRVKELIKAGVPLIILLRGLPGSGKSTLAKNLLFSSGAKGSIHSTDDFFHVPRGGKGQTLYQYDPLRLGEAHEWNRVQVLRAIAHGVTPIIVDNTNIQKWEMLPYVEMALEPWEAENKLRRMAASGSLPKNNICSSLGPARQSMIGKKCSCGFIVGETCKDPYEVELLEPLTWWYRNPARLAKVNQHGVSQKKITQMLSNFDFNLSGKGLVNHMLKIKPITPPIPQRENIRPSNQPRKSTSSDLSGAPIFSNVPPKPNHGNQYGVRPSNMFPPNLPGNNAFGPSAANQFQNPPRFPPGPHQQLQFPHGFVGFPAPPPSTQAPPPSTQAPTPSPQAPLFSNRSQFCTPNIPPSPKAPLFSNRTQFCTPNTRPQMPQYLEQMMKDKPKKEVLNTYSLNHQTLSMSTSNINSMPDDNRKDYAFSSQPKERNENPVKGSLATSESNIHEKSLEAISFVGSECKEMTEEELNEWRKNNSRWGWDSSDDDSEDECKIDVDEPKPERVLKLRHNNNLSRQGLKGDETSQNTKEDNSEVPEWNIDDDPLISWITTEVKIENIKGETVGPLPPRKSKRKRLPGNLTDPDDSPEEGKNNIILDQTEVAVTQQIHSLLAEFEVKDKELDFQKEVSEDNADLIKADENSSIPENLDSVHVLGGSAELKKSDAVKSYCVLNNDEVSSVKSDTSSVKDDEKSNQSPDSEIFVIESERMLIDFGETVNLNSESNSKAQSNKDQPSQAVFNEFLSTKPNKATTDATSTLTNDMVPKDELDSCRMGKSGEISSSDTNEQNEMTPENLMLLVPLIKEGLQWFDQGYNRSECRKKETYNPEIKNDIKVTEPSACEQMFPVPVSESTNVIVRAKENEEINRSEHTPTDPVEENLELIENSEAPGKNRSNENTKSIDSIPVCERELMETNNTSNVSEISHSAPEVKETETCSHLEAADTTILETAVCSDDLVKSLGSDSKNIWNLGTSASNVPIALESNVSKEVPGIKYAQDIAKSNANVITSGDALRKEASDVISDKNIMQSCIPSTSTVSHSSAFESDHSCEKVDSAGEPSDIKIEPLVDKEPTISLLEILENLKKKKMARKISASSVEPVEIQETSENFSSEEVCENANSQAPLYPIVSEIALDPINVSALSEFYIDEAESFFKTSKGKEKSLTDWSALFEDEDEGDTEDIDDESETFPLVLDPNFIQQICQKFGNPYQDSMDESSKFSSGNNDSGVRIQVPAKLARELHECWLKTQWNTILDEEEASQNMVIEDELLAHQLQALEEEELKEKRDSSNTPNLREIMDMEMAMAIYKADQNRNTANPQKNDLSVRLSWDMLTKEFPHIPQDIITEVFSAYNFSYESSREALVASLPDYERSVHENKVKDVVSPEILAAQEKALIEKAKLESLKSKEPPVEIERTVVESEDEGSWEVQVDQARKAATLNRRLQKERHAQAQAASRSGIPSAAAYYCRMASLHKQKVDEANRKAANILSRVFTGEYNDFKGGMTGDKEISQPPMTLDMHSMTVLEALRVLNAFLDAHADWLRNSKRRSSQGKMVTLFLITGRGVNSLGGIPRIKPAVEKQLEKRGVWYEELNPGLLRVMVSSNLSPARK